MNESRLTQVIMGVMLIVSFFFVREEAQLALNAFHAGQTWLAAEDGAFLSIVVFQIFGTGIYLVARLGYFKRISSHQPASQQELEAFLDAQAVPPLVILVPSYKEEAQIIKQTLLAAALQDYPNRRVVLLIDDPPAPSTQEERLQLNAARKAPKEICLVLEPQAELLQRAWQDFATRLSQGALHVATEMDILAALYEDVATWFKQQAEIFPRGTHTEAFFVQQVLLQPFHAFRLKAQELQTRASILSPGEIVQEYQRLVSLFQVEISSFERKKYRNLSHEPNKAMNLYSGPVCQVQKSVFGKIPLSPFQWRLEIRREV